MEAEWKRTGWVPFTNVFTKKENENTAKKINSFNRGKNRRDHQMYVSLRGTKWKGADCLSPTHNLSITHKNLNKKEKKKKTDSFQVYGDKTRKKSAAPISLRRSLEPSNQDQDCVPTAEKSAPVTLGANMVIGCAMGRQRDPLKPPPT